MALLRKLLALVVCLASAHSTFAIDCPAAKVLSVQVENNAIVILLEGQNWHLLGFNEHVATKMKLATVLAAQSSGKRVMLRYPDGYNCTAYELDTPTMAVRTVD